MVAEILYTLYKPLASKKKKKKLESATNKRVSNSTTCEFVYVSIHLNEPSKIHAYYYTAKAITLPVIVTRLDDVLKLDIKEDYREIL